MANRIIRLRYLLISAAIVSQVPTAALADPNVQTFDDSSARNLDCQCVKQESPVTGACALLNLSERSRDASYPTWVISITPPPGQPIDLSLACWRKRDQPGDGLCCSENDDQSDVRFFWGQVQ